MQLGTNGVSMAIHVFHWQQMDREIFMIIPP